MSNTGHRDLFDQVRGAEGRKVEPKFPAAALLDEHGRKVEPEVLFSPDDPDVKQHRDRLGCPCCDAKLRWTPLKEKTMGSAAGKRKGFFSSFDLDDHKKCDLASSDDKLSKKTRSRLEFFTQDGPKVLYWNIPYRHGTLKLDAENASPIKELEGMKRTGREDGDGLATYQIESMEEFLQLSEHIDFDDAFWDDVVIYDEEHRFSWHDFVFGNESERFLTSTFDQAVQGLRQPKVTEVDIAPIKPGDARFGAYRPGVRVAFDQDRHLYTIESDAVELDKTKDGHVFKSQLIIQTESDEVFQAIIEASNSGKPIVIHGAANNHPKEIENVRSRWPIGEYPNNNLRTYMFLHSARDVAVMPEKPQRKISKELRYGRDHE